MIDPSNTLKQNPLKFEKWLDELSNHANFDRSELLTLAERATHLVFQNNKFQPTYGRISIKIYESIVKEVPSAVLSAAYLRIRILRNANFNDPFFSAEILQKKLVEILDVDISEIKTLAKNWQSSGIDIIKKLRELKNWINVLEEYESTVGIEIATLSEIKKIKPLLP